MNVRLWAVSATELRGQLIVLVIVTWTLAALNTFVPGPRYRTGELKGADFIHFYVLGNLALEGRGDLLYDAGAQIATQERLVPDSKGIWFVPINGPQFALVFAGLAWLPYLWAAFAWACVIALVYGACVWLVLRRCPSLQTRTLLVALAAAGFPPFCSLVLHGQTSVMPLACLTGAYLAFRSDRKWLAGIAIGSLVIKPHFALAAGVVMLFRREWRVVGGAIAAAAAQWSAPALLFGAGALSGYFSMIRRVPRFAELLEPKPYQFHSVRAFWSLLIPQPSVVFALYVLTVAGVLALSVRLWRPSVPLAVRFSGLSLATVLVPPHTGVYDLVLLVPAFMLTIDWSERAVDPAVRRVIRAVLYFSYVVPFAGPFAGLTHVQASVPMFLAWLATLHWATRQGADHVTPARLHPQ